MGKVWKAFISILRVDAVGKYSIGMLLNRAPPLLEGLSFSELHPAASVASLKRARIAFQATEHTKLYDTDSLRIVLYYSRCTHCTSS